MIVIAILNTKGGSGKTTLSINLMRALQYLNYKVILVDTDPQGTLRNWHASGGHTLVNLIAMDRPTIDKNIHAINNEFDIVLIDGAASNHDLMRSALKAADIVLVPTKPTEPDIWGSSPVIELIKERQDFVGKPYASFVITCRNGKAKDQIAAREAMNEIGIPCLDGMTTNLVVYHRGFSTGKTVFDSTDDKASKEMMAIANEIREIIENGENKLAGTARK